MCQNSSAAVAVQAHSRARGGGAGEGGQHANLVPGGVNEIFASFKKTGCLDTFCTFQTWVLKKVAVFNVDVIFTTWRHSTATGVGACIHTLRL